MAGDSSLQEVVSVFGQPVAGNPTQYMMEKAFAAAGLDWRYLTLEVAPENLGDAIRGVRAMGFRGTNLTIPHKVEVIPLLDRLTDAAELIGAVNCVIREDDVLIGENADGKGFVESLRGVIEPAGKHIVILGAGGAARAIAVETALAGAAEMTIVNRSPERGQALVDHLNARLDLAVRFVAWQGDFAVPEDCDLLVQATSLGFGDADARVPLEKSTLRQDLVVADVIFNPPDTRLIREAQQAGAQTVDGQGMLVHQAVICFRWWTGVEPDAALMREALEEFLSI